MDGADAAGRREGGAADGTHDAGAAPGEAMPAAAAAAGAASSAGADAEVAAAVAAVAGLRAENRLLCSNFEELQGVHLRLQERAEATKSRLVEEQGARAAAFREHMREKRELQDELRRREEEVLRMRADGMQKSDFQRLQLQIREELEAPYEESIRVLKATADEARLERERLAREHMQEKVLLEAAAAELRRELSALQGQRDTDADILRDQLQCARDERGTRAREPARATGAARAHRRARVDGADLAHARRCLRGAPPSPRTQTRWRASTARCRSAPRRRRCWSCPRASCPRSSTSCAASTSA